MLAVDIEAACTRLLELVELAHAGKDVIICRDGSPVALIMRLAQTCGGRRLR